MADEKKQTPKVPVSAQGEMAGMRKFMLYKRVKKTSLNPDGWKLLMVTFAPSKEYAEEMCRDAIYEEDGPPYKVVDVAEELAKATAAK